MLDFDIHGSLRVIHCDDDPFELERVQKALVSAELGIKFDVESFLEPAAFKKRLLKGHHRPDVIMLDVDLGSATGEQGPDLAQLARAAFNDCVIVMCSAMDDAATISQSLRMGADDFISKRSERAELGLRVINSYKLSQLKRGMSSDQPKPQHAIAGRTLEAIANRVPRILGSAISSVHICGESGTGKEVVAELIASQLATGTPFVKVNCGAISPTLLESELFGHVKGAFTGATSEKRGFIEAAHGGWIFLDEVATLSSSAQVALLRAIENQEIIRVGDNKVRKIKTKFLSATNAQLPGMVKDGTFRGDLWQRLCEAEVYLPPLRDRPDEIEALVNFFCNEMAGGPYDIDDAAMEALCAAPWTEGNVRELRNCLRAMTELHVNKLLTPLAIPAKVWATLDQQTADKDLESSLPAVPTSSSKKLTLRWDTPSVPPYDWLSDKLLVELIHLHAGGEKVSLRALAKLLGISRSTLSGRLKTLAQKNMTDLAELAKVVSIGDT